MTVALNFLLANDETVTSLQKYVLETVKDSVLVNTKWPWLVSVF